MAALTAWDMSECKTWQFNANQFIVSAAVRTHFMHTSPCMDKVRLQVRAQTLLRSDACCSSLLVRKEASEQDHLADANH